MITRSIVYAIAMFAESIFLLWVVMSKMINLKKILIIFPFFVLFSLLTYQAGLILNRVYITWMWMGIELFYGLSILSILLILMKKNK